ncbi:MAG: hypothetical protein H6Q31_2529 [Bacteroidetes bacterium]|nr:hypothetical protein [Bacteroidota bacterium]
MKRTITMLLVLVLAATAAFAQLTSVATHNSYQAKATWTGPDSTMPYRNDQGIRSAWVTKDMDKDGKPEIVATDYSNGGRVHVFEFKAPNILELVWSSPKMYAANPNSTPRWVRDGDLDGDGNREIIFPVGARYTGKVAVFEYTGTDNSYGVVPGVPDLELPATQFDALLGAGAAMRMDRETGTVEDLDGDGRDELIMANQNNKVYILGVAGDVGGFGSWDIEGGDPATYPENGFSGGSWWHSLPADIDGDGKKEIVNHYWNFYGFWSIDVKGPDSYRYPTPGIDTLTNPKAKNFYHEYYPEDATAYMGVQAVDLNGDGAQEIAGISYVDNTTEPYNSRVVLVTVAKGDTGVYVWKDSTQFGIIGEKLWELAGKTSGSHWGIGAYDFNGNGKEELLIGGSAEFNVTALEYKGTGKLTDAANYTKTMYYPGEVAFYHNVDYYDSLGVSDTVRYESPFVSKMFTGTDVNGNGKKEVMLSYQSVADSVTYVRYTWDTTQTPDNWRKDSTWKKVNTVATNLRMLEWTGSTFAPIDMMVVTPDQYVLDQNYPNPFNPSTSIRFSLPVENRISLVIYDMTGREVKTLIGSQQMAKGAYQVEWDGTNNAGTGVASGSYVYTLKFGNFSTSQKMMLVR